jgi:hypothetical protein
VVDFYPILLRAINALPESTKETRRGVFDRAVLALEQTDGLGDEDRETYRPAIEAAYLRIESSFSAHESARQEEAHLAVLQRLEEFLSAEVDAPLSSDNSAEQKRRA